MSHLAERGWVCVAINYRLAPRHLAGPHRRREAGDRLGEGAHRRVRRRPRVRRGHRRLGRRSPVRPRRAHPQRSRVPARLRGRRHPGAGRRPVLRRVRLDQPRRHRQPRHADPARGAGLQGRARRRSGDVGQGVTDVAGRPRRAADVPPPRHLRQRSFRWHRPGRSPACSTRCRRRRWSTPSSPEPSMRSTSTPSVPTMPSPAVDRFLAVVRTAHGARAVPTEAAEPAAPTSSEDLTP